MVGRHPVYSIWQDTLYVRYSQWMRHQYAEYSFVSHDTLKSYFSQNVIIFFSWFKRSFLLTFIIILAFKRSVYHLVRTWKETFTNFIYFLTQRNVLLIMCAIFSQRSGEMGCWGNTTNFTVALFIFYNTRQRRAI